MNTSGHINERIVFLMPSKAPDGPVGGYKVVYEYANRLAVDGFQVTIVYPLTYRFSEQSPADRLKTIPRALKWIVKGISCKKWFALDPRVCEKAVLSLNERDVPEGDVYVATALHTAFYLAQYKIPSRRKFYLIQGFENWRDSDTTVYDSYKAGLHNIVISDWLHRHVTAAGAEAEIIKNGFDFNYFKLSVPIKERDPKCVSMMWHSEERKGGPLGLKVLQTVKERHPDLKVIMFGVPERPAGMPEWVEYHCRPDRETHNMIYNRSAIYLAPSYQEGWGLTVGESMICGAAVVCTDTLGFLEMVTDGKNGLISPCGDAEMLTANVCRLIEDPELRIAIAREGNLRIRGFSWERSYDRLKALIRNSLLETETKKQVRSDS